MRAACREIGRTAEEAGRLALVFAQEVAAASGAIPEAIRRFHEKVPADWHQRAPVYYTYPHTLSPGILIAPMKPGTAGLLPTRPGTLLDTARLAAHARGLGCGSMYVLPVFDSPGGDAGFDVRSWSIRADLGGEAGFDALRDAAIAAGMPLILDLPLNHLSIEHEWFRKLQDGDLEMADRFLQVPDDWVKTGEREIDRRTYAVYRDGKGLETLRWIIFPHASRDHFLNVGTRRFYHTFYPFQPDVNLRNPDVLRENLRLMVRLLARGVLGFRLDAMMHWLKRDGTAAENLPETFAYARLLNLFSKKVCPKSKLLPEIGARAKEAARYLDETDGFWGFESRCAIPESVFLRSAAPYWAAVDSLPEEMPEHATIFAMVTHHDELPGQFLHSPEKTLRGMLAGGGVPFRDGTSVCGRFAPLVGGDPARIALAYFLLFLFPRSTPTIYYGEEAGLGNDPEYARREAARLRRPYDARDVHRQVVSLEDLQGHPVADLLRDLSRLRREYPALRSHALPQRLAVENDAVVAMRFGPLLAAANLGESAVVVDLPKGYAVIFRGGEATLEVLPGGSFLLAELIGVK